MRPSGVARGQHYDLSSITSATALGAAAARRGARGRGARRGARGGGGSAPNPRTDLRLRTRSVGKHYHSAFIKVHQKMYFLD